MGQREPIAVAPIRAWESTVTDQAERLAGFHAKARRRALRDAAFKYVRPDDHPQESYTASENASSERYGLPCRSKSRSWVAAVASKAYTLAKVVTSPPCSDEVFEARQAACGSCPHLTQIGDGKRFCECCGCPRWSGSELSKKNRYSAHRCPADPPRF